MASFETKTCSRCGGSGHYSYCQRWGTICFKCGGQKKVYTKRGQAAKLLMERLLSTPMKNLQVGQTIYCGDGVFRKSRFSKITAIHPDPLNPPLWTVETEFMSIGCSPSTTFRVAADAQHKQGVFMICEAYQNMLTKQGKEPAWLSTIAWG